ncbi:MAG: hypothetical protein ABI743_01960 [bacterium]
MRRLILATAWSLGLVLIGCSGGTTAPVVPAASSNGQQSTFQPPAALVAELDSFKPSGFMQITDPESGAVIGHLDMIRNADGTFEADPRQAGDVNYGPVANTLFSVTVTIATTGPNAPRGYTGAGSPIYYIGDTVQYDYAIRRVMRRRQSRFYTRGTLSISAEHIFASDDSPIPECVAGQNPNAVSPVVFADQLPPNGTVNPAGGTYSWSYVAAPPQANQGPNTFNATGLLFQLCDLPGMQYGTDQIAINMSWTSPNGNVTLTLFDEAVGIYDP